MRYLFCYWYDHSIREHRVYDMNPHPAYKIQMGFIHLHDRYLPVWRWYDELGKNEQPDKYYDKERKIRVGEWNNLYVIDMKTMETKEGEFIKPKMVYIEYDSNMLKLPTLKVEFSNAFKDYIDWFLNKKRENEHYEYNPK